MAEDQGPGQDHQQGLRNADSQHGVAIVYHG